MTGRYPNRYKKRFAEETLIGKKFGMLTVHAYSHCHKTKTHSTHYWFCVCECGKEKNVQNGHLIHGNTKSCGCNRHNADHYLSFTNTPEKMLEIESNIVPDENGCKIWPYTYNSKGYGKISFNNKTCEPHRVIYFCKHGKVPKGMVVRHLCNNKACVSLDHLELGTVRDNALDAKHHASKLTWELVLYIRTHESHIGTTPLGRKYGVSHKTIEQILKGATWKEGNRK
jgi:hypothetical protein